MIALPDPIIEPHAGASTEIWVVRDDLIPGGTKRRYVGQLFDRHREVVYASPVYGGAQVALGHAAKAAGKRATIFCAKRKEPHRRSLEAKAAGAVVVQVAPGYLSQVQKAASDYAKAAGAHLLAFGADEPEAVAAIANVAARVWAQHGPFDEVWSVAGSGVLTRGLQQGMPQCARFFAVQIGREPSAGIAKVIPWPKPFEHECPAASPFPSCRNYDLKGWAVAHAGAVGRALFWNVLGPPP